MRRVDQKEKVYATNTDPPGKRVKTEKRRRSAQKDYVKRADLSNQEGGHKKCSMIATKKQNTCRCTHNMIHTHCDQGSRTIKCNTKVNIIINKYVQRCTGK